MTDQEDRRYIERFLSKTILELTGLKRSMDDVASRRRNLEWVIVHIKEILKGLEEEE